MHSCAAELLRCAVFWLRPLRLTSHRELVRAETLRWFSRLPQAKHR